VPGLPLIQHCEIEAGCCGCLREVAADITYSPAMNAGLSF
jgi:hypothetical protein